MYATPIKLLIIAVLSLTASLVAAAASLQFTGSDFKVLEQTPERNTGLDKIYILHSTSGVSASYTTTTDNPVKWYRYSNLGGGYAEELTNITTSGKVTTLSEVEGDMGYIIEDGTNRSYFWITDYSRHTFSARKLSVSSESDCSSTILLFEGNALPIHYYTINGQQRTLSREITVEYYTLEEDRENKQYVQISKTETLASISESGNVFISNAPLCDTRFVLSGDTFSHQWGARSQVRTEAYSTPAVACFTFAEQTPHTTGDELSNEITDDDAGTLGGSAPAEITFSAIVTDAVLHHEWQFASDSEFTDLIYRFNDSEVTYIFREEGVTYVRYIGSNADGSCETYGETSEVRIGNSELKIPNAFSPGASEGVNDVWKVSYRSIIRFECHIFNRNGEEIFSFNDPSQGWDGKKGGKLVKPGVYYYVIDAEGADGKHYKKAGDINIVRYNNRMSGSSSGTTEDTTTETE